VLGGAGAQVVDDLLHGHRLGHGGDLGRHDAAGRLLPVAQQRADHSRLVHTHEAQQRLGLVVRQVADDVGRVVRVHLLEDVRRALVAEVVDEVRLVLVLELGDRLGRLHVVEVFEDARTLRGAELLEHVGHVGRVQFVEALVRDREAHVRQVAVEQVHVVPRDQVLGELPAEQAGDRSRGVLHHGVQAAQDAADSHLGAQQAQLVLTLGELEVVHADDLHALGVHDLFVEQVAREQHFIRLQVAEAQRGSFRVEHDAVLVELAHVLAPRQHERRLCRAEEGERRHAREHLARGDRDV